MYKAYIFDLDGTLLDTLDDLWAAVNAALEKYGYPLRTREEVCAFVGNGVKNLVERASDGAAGVAFERLLRSSSVITACTVRKKPNLTTA